MSRVNPDPILPRSPDGDPDHDLGGVSWTAIQQAAERLLPVLRPTPTRLADALGRVLGRAVYLKPEHLQRAGSFKIRGAYNRIAQLPVGVPVVAASAGNHAQGVALASSLTGHPATIFMPQGASLPKVRATQDYGATVEMGGDSIDDCFGRAQAFADQHGAVFVPPFDDRDVIAGQATLGLELVAELGTASPVVLVPVGGGGLLAGVALALRRLRPDVRIVGVEANGAAAMRASLDAGRRITLDSVTTMADGIALRSPGERTLAITKALVDDVITVTEDEISQAVLLLLERAKAVVEPSGAVGIAAVLGGKVPGTGPICAVLSGGNVDPLLLTQIIGHGLSASGRFLRLRVVFSDRPGSLAALTASVARLGLNVIDVEHHRTGVRLSVFDVEVLLTVETRNPDHRDQMVRVLTDEGFRVELLS